MLIVPQRIYCDEAGYTGARLLDENQPIFAYASVAVSAEEADALVTQIRVDFRPQGDELKGKNLMRSARGRKAVKFALTQLRGRYIVTGFDKKLSLAGKFFEYIFEPVLAANSLLFYKNNFHKFIAALIYVTFVAKSPGIVDLVEQFEIFMRSLDPNDAPIIFETDAGQVDISDSLKDIILFIQGYRSLILEEGRTLTSVNDQTGEHIGKWALDLTCTAVWGQLAEWTDRVHLLDVVCDDSKPLTATLSLFNEMVNRPEVPRMSFGGKNRPMTFNLARPIVTGSSAEHSGLQLADIVSSAFIQALAHQADAWSQEYLEEMQSQVHEDCIFADDDYMENMNPKNPEAAINYLVLRELSERAVLGKDPLHGMELVYQYGRETVGAFLRNAFRSSLT